MAKAVPSLRFPEFEGEWNKKRLKALFSEFKSGQGITASKISDTDVYPVYGGNGLRGYTNRYTHDGFYLLIGRQGALCGNINRSYGKAFISEHAIACKANITSDTEWLAQRLKYLNLNRFSESSAQPGLSVYKLLRFKLIVPSLPEQQKIATFLTSVDNKLKTLRKKKTLLKQYKKGIMQKIFSRELRFKDEQGKDFPEWEEKKLGEVGRTFNGLSGKTKKDFGKGNKPFIQYMQVFSSSSIDTSKFGLVKIENDENQNQVQYGDVFFTTSSETPNEIGTSSVLIEQVEEVYLNSFCFGYRPNSTNELVPMYVQFFFRSEEVRKEIVKLAQGSTRFNMSKVELMKFKFDFPQKEEQAKIANFLSAIDKKVEAIARQIEKTERWKKGLLQRMFV